MPKRVIKYFSVDGHIFYLFFIILAASSIGISSYEVNRESNKRFKAVQESRVQIAYDQCNNQNMRHNDTLNRVHQLTLKNIATVNAQLVKGVLTKLDAAARIQQINASEAPVDFLIDGIIPEINCISQLKTRFGPDAPKYLTGDK